VSAALPQVERMVWPGQAHFATATATAPDLVAGTLRRFLAGN